MYHPSCILTPVSLHHRWLRQRCLWWEIQVDLFCPILSWHRAQEAGWDHFQYRSTLEHSELVGMARRPAEGISQLPLDRKAAKSLLSCLSNNTIVFWADGALRERGNICSLLGSASRGEEGHISSSQVYLVRERQTSIVFLCLVNSLSVFFLLLLRIPPTYIIAFPKGFTSCPTLTRKSAPPDIKGF